MNVAGCPWHGFFVIDPTMLIIAAPVFLYLISGLCPDADGESCCSDLYYVTDVPLWYKIVVAIKADREIRCPFCFFSLYVFKSLCGKRQKCIPLITEELIVA